jgi:hypothetical protein
MHGVRHGARHYADRCDSSRLCGVRGVALGRICERVSFIAEAAGWNAQVMEL